MRFPFAAPLHTATRSDEAVTSSNHWVGLRADGVSRSEVLGSFPIRGFLSQPPLAPLTRSDGSTVAASCPKFLHCPVGSACGGVNGLAGGCMRVGLTAARGAAGLREPGNEALQTV